MKQKKTGSFLNQEVQEDQFCWRFNIKWTCQHENTDFSHKGIYSLSLSELDFIHVAVQSLIKLQRDSLITRGREGSNSQWRPGIHMLFTLGNRQWRGGRGAGGSRPQWQFFRGTGV